MTSTTPAPSGYRSLNAYLCVAGADAAIRFYCDIFGATERMRLDGPDGTVGHAELEIGDSVLMLSDEYPGMAQKSPKTLGGTPVSLSVYVDDVDDVYARAIAAGATSVREVADQFYGDRSGQVLDPFGHIWAIATHVEDVDAEEMARRAAAVVSGDNS